MKKNVDCQFETGNKQGPTFSHSIKISLDFLTDAVNLLEGTVSVYDIFIIHNS